MSQPVLPLPPPPPPPPSESPPAHLWLALVLALCSCAPASPAPEHPPRPPATAATEDDCQRMCSRLRVLKCDYVTPECEAACWNAESSGVITTCPALVAKATDCDDAKRLSQCDSDEWP